MELLVKFAIVGFFAWAFWKCAQPQCHFVVRIAAGVPSVRKGVVTPAFLEHLRDLCREHGIEHGLVRGVARGQHISLAFSRAFPPEASQALRNWWAISGWPTGPRRRRFSK
jgi:hypothetical protein